MTTFHRRAILPAITAFAVTTMLVIGGPAVAQTEPVAPTPSSERGEAVQRAEGLEPAAAGIVNGRVLFVTDDNPTPRPLTFGSVSFYRLDTVTGEYLLQQFATSFDAEGDWSISGLPVGTYKISYIQGAEYPGAREWYNGERYIVNAQTVELFEGAPLTLPTATLQPRAVAMSRIAGADRFETNVALSNLAFPTGGGVNVVIVNGLDYPDALSAGPLANALDASMLMVTPTSIPPAVAAELTRLDPNVITIIGGTGVVSAAVEAQLATYVGNPATQLRRIAGADRYATSRAVLVEGFGTIPIESVLLATGRNFPDALAAGPAAGSIGGAVLLVDGARPTLDGPTSTLLDTLNVPAYVIGGTGSITTGIENAVATLGLDVDRVAGVDRYRTSIAIGIRFFFFADIAQLVNANGFADALSAGPIGGVFNAPIYLSSQACIPDSTFDELIAVLANQIFVVGGSGVLAPAVESFTSCTGRDGPLAPI